MRTLELAYIAVLLSTAEHSVAQTYIHYSLAWSEVVEGSTTPVSSPNGMLEPGESARFKVSIDFTPIGTLVPYNPPIYAPVAGLYYAPFAVGSTEIQSGVNWSNFTIGYGFQGEAGSGALGGLAGCVVIQPFPEPGQDPIAIDPLIDVWQQNWTPSSFSPRSVRYGLGYASGGNDLFVRIGTSSSGSGIYDVVSAPFNLGTFINIPIVPSPGAALILAPLGIAAMRRRRTRIS